VGGVKLTFTIPGKPQGKERARRDPRTGRWFTPTKTRRYEGQVRLLASHALAIAGLRRTWPMDGRYMLRLRLFFPDARRRDADNVVKAVQDAMRGVLFTDDHRVGIECPPWEVDRAQPRAEIEVLVLDDHGGV
jgi:Holliday junction resolvase RusA-like endonuclease